MRLLTNERCHAVRQVTCVATCADSTYGFVFLGCARMRNDKAAEDRQRTNCLRNDIEPNFREQLPGIYVTVIISVVLVKAVLPVNNERTDYNIIILAFKQLIFWSFTC